MPNFLKVLNPLFLDDLRAQLEAAGDNKIRLLNLRKRIARIRVFDPACGSGNLLAIACKQMRLEKLFDLYAKMVVKPATAKQPKAVPARKVARRETA